jgi:hypothetical protein
MWPRRSRRRRTLSELGILPLVVGWITQDTVKALVVAACVCTVLWKLLGDDDWHLNAGDTSDAGDGGD